MTKFLDLAGLTAYDGKLKEWINAGTVDITDDEIKALFATPISYQMVDLGLSVKWANMNVGASSPEDAGLYFSWGNVDGHAVDEEGNTVDGYSFNENTYSTTLGGQFTGSKLDAEHDAATANMSEGWRMPTVGEIIELVNGTTQRVDTENGGMIFTSKTNGNSIFIPFSGVCNGSKLFTKGSYGYVWSSSLSEEVGVAQYLHFTSGDVDSYGYGRCEYGFSVRGVHA